MESRRTRTCYRAGLRGGTAIVTEPSLVLDKRLHLTQPAALGDRQDPVGAETWEGMYVRIALDTEKS